MASTSADITNRLAYSLGIPKREMAKNTAERVTKYDRKSQVY